MYNGNDMERKTGIAVPLASLYTKDCPVIGDFYALKDFARFCTTAGIRLIQLLPVNDTGTQSSPYSGLSAFALHPVYIRLEALPEFEEAMKSRPIAKAYKDFIKKYKYASRFDYQGILTDKTALLHLIFSHLEKQMNSEVKKVPGTTVKVISTQKMSLTQSFEKETVQFIKENPWIVPYAVYKNLKDDFSQASWKEWPENFQKFTKSQVEMRFANRALKSGHNFFVWCQIRAHQQFQEAAQFVKQQGIMLKGDIPILMNEDSCDAWYHKDYFIQELRAGSPPDGENPEGQNWGFPIYNWANLKKDDYRWWKDRVRSASKFYDAFRIDHILGFFRIWAVPEKESTAYLGHTEPYAAISADTLLDAGFDRDRLKWLSKPHIPTQVVEDITWNHDEAHKILASVADQIGTEELWNFKETITGDKDLRDIYFCNDVEKDARIKIGLTKKWKDRCLIEITQGQYIPASCYRNSTSWNTLSREEKEKLSKIFEDLSKEASQIFRKQALEVLTPIVKETGMTACAEDLGAGLECVSSVLEELDILSLKVIRWSRHWFYADMPYEEFQNYRELSVATTSVHDSSTLRQWWNTEKDSVRSFLKMDSAFWKKSQTESAGSVEENSNSKQTATAEKEYDWDKINSMAEKPFDSQVAQYVLEQCAKSNSALFVNPLQDFLYLDQAYFMEDQDAERINIPGTVNAFNWTYRIPLSLEELEKNESLISKIKSIAAIHDKAK